MKHHTRIKDAKKLILDKRYSQILRTIDIMPAADKEDVLIKNANYYFAFMILGEFDKAEEVLRKLITDDINILSRIKDKAIINLTDLDLPENILTDLEDMEVFGQKINAILKE